MKPELEKLARHRLSRARDALAEGQQLLAAGSFMGAVNRLYYAAFYAARALLALREVDASRHSGMIALFQKHFVKTRLVEVEEGSPSPCIRKATERRLWRFLDGYGRGSWHCPKRSQDPWNEKTG